MGIYIVNGEHHWLPSCPCIDCVRERQKRELTKPYRKSRLSIMSVEAAHLLGFIPRRNPSGSLAKQLASRNA